MISNILKLTQEKNELSNAKVLFKKQGSYTESRAFETKNNAKIIILIPRRLMSKSVVFKIYSETLDKCLYEIKPSLTDYKESLELYEGSIPTKKLGKGLYFGEIEINTPFNKLYSETIDNKLVFTTNKKLPDIQITVSDFKYPTHKLYGGIIYQIFVDRFARSNNIRQYRKDAVLISDWNAEIPEYQKFPGESIKNNYFYGGDLYGIIEKLKYIKSLGVNAIYLTPIFESPSNHKYDTANYMKVDGGFGGDKALKELIKEAKKCNIGIILDGVFNHTGSDSIYFNSNGFYETIGAYQSKSSEYYSWYNFINHPDEYDCWWGIKILPKINP